MKGTAGMVMLAAAGGAALCGPGAYGQGWTGAAPVDGGEHGAVCGLALAAAGGGCVIVGSERRGITDREVCANLWNGSAWAGPTILDPSSYFDAMAPELAAGAGGSVFAVFEQYEWQSARSRIYASRWNGTAWEGPTLIDAAAGGAAGNPDIAADTHGNAVAVFWQVSGGDKRICANRWDGAAWEGAEIIDAGASRGAEGSPAIVCDGAGGAVAAFDRFDGTTWRVYANRWDGAAWRGAIPIDAGNGRSAWPPRLAASGDGCVFAAFRQENGGRLCAYANRWNGAAWEGAVPIDAAGGGDADSPSIACGSGGSGMAVFSQMSGDGRRIHANRWNGTAWEGPGAIDAGPGGGASGAEVASDGAGNAFAVFARREAGAWRVYANRWNGTAWEGPYCIDAGPADGPRPLGITFDASGNAFAAYHANGRVYANRHLPSANSRTAPGGDRGLARDAAPPCLGKGGRLLPEGVAASKSDMGRKKRVLPGEESR